MKCRRHLRPLTFASIETGMKVLTSGRSTRIELILKLCPVFVQRGHGPVGRPGRLLQRFDKIFCCFRVLPRSSVLVVVVFSQTKVGLAPNVKKLFPICGGRPFTSALDLSRKWWMSSLWRSFKNRERTLPTLHEMKYASCPADAQTTSDLKKRAIWPTFFILRRFKTAATGGDMMVDAVRRKRIRQLLLSGSSLSAAANSSCKWFAPFAKKSSNAE
jgi:hypothetical protein